MKKLIVALLLLSFFGGANAQVLDPDKGPRAWSKEKTEQSEAITLSHIREADVMWSKRIWRTIDLRQKQNLPLYYPLVENTLGKKSFVQIIFEMLEDSNNVGLNAYYTYELKERIPPHAAIAKFEAGQEADSLIFDPETGECLGVELNMYRKSFEGEIKEGITKIHLMEDWFFDKQRSVMDVRILALGLEIPVYNVELSEQQCDGDDIVAFSGWKPGGGSDEIWFFFPDLRPTMAKKECYNRQNDAARVSFDDIFLKRMFDSYIIREENVYDRFINEYTKGLDALLEAEKISNEIRDYEQNLWQY